MFKTHRLFASENFRREFWVFGHGGANPEHKNFSKLPLLLRVEVIELDCATPGGISWFNGFSCGALSRSIQSRESEIWFFWGNKTEKQIQIRN
jgi:hypothetical protein